MQIDVNGKIKISFRRSDFYPYLKIFYSAFTKFFISSTRRVLNVYQQFVDSIDHRSITLVLRETVTALKDGALLGISVSILSHVHFPIRHMVTDKNHMPVYSHEHRADRYKT